MNDFEFSGKAGVKNIENFEIARERALSGPLIVNLGRVSISGRAGHLSEPQEQALIAFRDGLPAEERERCDENTLLRFLRARKFDVALAREMYLKMLYWRADFKVDRILERDPPKLDLFRKSIPFSFHGFDKTGIQGRPLYIEKTGRISPDFLLNNFTIEEIMLVHIWSMEVYVKRCAVGSQRVEHHVEQFCTVLDLDGLGLAHRKAVSIIKLFSACDQNNYPERLGVLCIINAPSVFPLIWSLVKGYIDPVSAQKIHVLGANYQQKLLELIDADQLPVEYGGTCQACRQHNPKATAQCCVPFPTEAELEQVFTQDETKMKMQEHTIKAGAHFELKIETNLDIQTKWYFRTAKHDVDFSLFFLPTNAIQMERSVVALKSVPHSNTGLMGLDVANEPGVLRFVWDNSASYWSSKTIYYSIEQTPFDIVLSARQRRKSLYETMPNDAAEDDDEKNPF